MFLRLSDYRKLAPTPSLCLVWTLRLGRVIEAPTCHPSERRTFKSSITRSAHPTVINSKSEVEPEVWLCAILLGHLYHQPVGQSLGLGRSRCRVVELSSVGMGFDKHRDMNARSWQPEAVNVQLVDLGRLCSTSFNIRPELEPAHTCAVRGSVSSQVSLTGFLERSSHFARCLWSMVGFLASGQTGTADLIPTPSGNGIAPQKAGAGSLAKEPKRSFMLGGIWIRIIGT